MSPIERIRREVFGVTQAVFAGIAGVSQATVSKWENGELEPGRDNMGLIRAEAAKRKIDWDDRWFFEPKPTAEERASA